MSAIIDGLWPAIGNRRASAHLAAKIGDAPVPLWVGLEHEFLVFDRQGGRVDFRLVVHDLALGRRDLVPSDRHAYRLSTGSMVTADTTEAEIAVPPAEVRPGFTRLVDGWARYERQRLGRRASWLSFVGDSTHLSVTMPPGIDGDRAADLFARHFAPGLMLLLDQRHSPGLLVRPRPYRLELGGEYAVGRALRAALAYATGAALACYAAAARGGGRAELPPRLAPVLERGVLRYGWYVSRHAFGDDLYEQGRATSLPLASGGIMAAGDHLTEGWRIARLHLEPLAARGDLEDADALVAGKRGLPCEQPDGSRAAGPTRSRRPRSAFGAALQPRRRAGYQLAPVMLTWQAAVFVVARDADERRAYLAVPGRLLDRFGRALDAGELDAVVVDYLGRPISRRTMRSLRDVARPGLFDRLGLRAGLLAPERDYWGRPIRLELRRGQSVATRLGTA
jgi:hypothetical protein